PSKRTEPLRRSTMPMIARSVVVLPAPLRPSSVTTSPSRTWKSMPCRMCDSPYQACSASTSSSAPASAEGARPAVASSSCLAGPHVGFAHLGVARDLAIVALGQDLSALQDGDAVRKVGNDVEIVLDHEDGPSLGDALDQLRDAGDV